MSFLRLYIFKYSKIKWSARLRSNYIWLMELYALVLNQYTVIRVSNTLYTENGFSNDLRETLTYGELLKHEFYLSLRIFGWVSYSNSFIKCIYKWARCILIHNFLSLGKFRVSKVYRKLRSPVNCSRIHRLNCYSIIIWRGLVICRTLNYVEPLIM